MSTGSDQATSIINADRRRRKYHCILRCSHFSEHNFHYAVARRDKKAVEAKHQLDLRNILKTSKCFKVDKILFVRRCFLTIQKGFVACACVGDTVQLNVNTCTYSGNCKVK